MENLVHKFDNVRKLKYQYHANQYGDRQILLDKIYVLASKKKSQNDWFRVSDVEVKNVGLL